MRFGSRGLSVKFDSVNLLKTTLSALYLLRSRRIGYRRRKVVGMREADPSETALSWSGPAINCRRSCNQIGHDGDVAHTKTKPCRDSKHNAVVGK
jgi:hypothetical protein